MKWLEWREGTSRMRWDQRGSRVRKSQQAGDRRAWRGPEIFSEWGRKLWSPLYLLPNIPPLAIQEDCPFLSLGSYAWPCDLLSQQNGSRDDVVTFRQKFYMRNKLCWVKPLRVWCCSLPRHNLAQTDWYRVQERVRERGFGEDHSGSSMDKERQSGKQRKQVTVLL